MKDYQMTINSVEAFVEGKMREGIIQEGVDAHTLAELFTAL